MLIENISLVHESTIFLNCICPIPSEIDDGDEKPKHILADKPLSMVRPILRNEIFKKYLSIALQLFPNWRKVVVNDLKQNINSD